MKRSLLCIGLLLAANAAQAESVLPFGKEWAQGYELPRPYGVGFDIFTMEQDYAIRSLTFTLPGVGPIDPDVIDVDNQVDHKDLKLDAWLFPFLNVFGVYGRINAETAVDLSAVVLPLPVSLGVLPVEYEGKVYGGGLTLVYGTDRWFVSLTGSWTRTSLRGDFDSTVKASSWQPRIGLVRGPWQVWVGGLHISAEERHRGVIGLPGLGNVPFDVTLAEKNAWNTTVGVRYDFDRWGDVTFEVGGGDRTTTLLNVTLRFPRDSSRPAPEPSGASSDEATTDASAE